MPTVESSQETREVSLTDFEVVSTKIEGEGDTPTKEELQPLIKAIREYVSVENEYEKIQSLQEEGLNVNEFLKSQILRFVLEFAAQIPYTNLHLKWEDNTIKAFGVDVLDHYEKAKTEQKNGRPYNEFLGIQRVIKSFKNGAHAAVILSPPWIGDYSFAFIFERKGNNEVIEHIVLYPEKLGTLVESQKYWKNLVKVGFFPYSELSISSTVSPKSTNEFVSQPLLFWWSKEQKQSSDKILNKIFLEFNPNRFADYDALEKIISAAISPTLNQYVQSLKDGKLDEAEKYIALAYHKTKEIKEGWDRYLLTKNGELLPTLPHISSYQSTMTPQQMAQMLRENGGSCPVLKSSPLSPTVQSLSLMFSAPSITTPNLPEQNTKTITCPSCGYILTISSGETPPSSCPHCGNKLSKVCPCCGKKH